MFNALKIRTKLLGAFLAIALIILAAALVGLLSLKSVNARMGSLYSEELLTTQELAIVDEAQLQIKVALYQFILAAEDRRDLEQEIAKQIAFANENMRLYGTTYLDPNERRAFARLQSAWTSYKQAAQQTLDLVKAGKTAQATENMQYGGIVFGNQGTVQQAAIDLIQIQGQVAAEEKNEAERIFKLAAWTMGGAGLSGVLLALGGDSF